MYIHEYRLCTVHMMSYDVLCVITHAELQYTCNLDTYLPYNTET